MSKWIVVIWISVTICVGARTRTKEEYAAMTHGAESKTILKVVNDQGVAVTNAAVLGNFHMADDKGNPFHGHTDDCGIYVAVGKCIGDWHFFVKKNGHYESFRDMSYLRLTNTLVVNGRWQPYGMTNTVVLKRKVNPVAMHVITSYRHKPVPKLDEFIGFDLMAGDWVIPHGKGTVGDVSIKFEKKVTGSSGFQFRHVLTFAFPNQFDGAYRLKKDMFSDLSSVYVANTNGVYASKMVFEIDRLSGRVEKDTLLAENEYLILRTRSKVDKYGRLKSAHYAKIYGPLYVSRSGLALTAYFNPNENDPNLEFDTTKNLNREEKGGLSP